MAKIYKGQTELQIKLTANVDVSGATCYIKYKKPSGEEGQWAAVIQTASTGVIYYNINSADDLDESGKWRLWTYVVWADGDYADGEAVTVKVYDPGD